MSIDRAKTTLALDINAYVFRGGDAADAEEIVDGIERLIDAKLAEQVVIDGRLWGQT